MSILVSRKKIYKGAFVLVGVLLLLALILYFALQTSYVQNQIKNKILSSLSEKYKAEWQVDEIKFDFFDELYLQGILFKDQQGDTLIAAREIKVDIGVFSLFKKSIYIDRLDIVDAHIELYSIEDSLMNFDFLLNSNPTTSTNSSTSDNDSEQSWSFGVSDIVLDGTAVRYHTPDLKVDHSHDKLQLNISDLDLSGNRVVVNDLDIIGSNSKILSLGESDENDEPFKFPDFGWNIEVADLDILESDLYLSLDSTSYDLHNLEVDVIDLKFNENSVKANIKGITGKYNDLIDFKKISGEAFLDNDLIQVKGLEMVTQRDHVYLQGLEGNINDMRWDLTKLDLKVSPITISDFKSLIPSGIQLNQKDLLLAKANKVHFTLNDISAKGLSLSYGNIIKSKLSFNTTLENNEISKIDIDVFSLDAMPIQIDRALDAFQWPDSLQQAEHIVMSGKITGNNKILNLKEINIDADHLGSLSISGKLENWNHPEKIVYDLEIGSLKTSASYIPIPSIESIAFDSLREISFAGIIKGSTSNSTISGSLLTGLGNITVDAAFENISNLDSLNYQGKIVLDKFDIGTFLKNADLNKISLNLEAIGKGTSLSTIDATLEGVVDEFSFKDYVYNNLQIKAKINENKIDGQLGIEDENINFSYDGIIDIANGGLIMDFESTINNFRPKEINLYSVDLNISGKVKSKLRFPFNAGEKGSFEVRDLMLSNVTDTVNVDSFLINAYKNLDSTFINVSSDFMKAQVDGVFDIRELPSAFESLLDSEDDPSALTINSSTFNIDAKIENLDPLDIILGRGVLLLDQATIKSKVNFKSKDIESKILIDSLFYNQFFSEKILITADNSDQVYFLNLDIDNAMYASNQIPVINIKNTYSNNELTTNFLAKDVDALPRLKFSTTYSYKDSFHTIAFQDSLVLNNKDWEVQPDNLIKMGSDKLLIDNLNFTNQREFLSLQSIGNSGDELALDFKNFNIRELVTLITGKPSDFQGNINGDFKVKGLNTEPYFIANMAIEDLVYKEIKVGEISIKAKDDPITRILTTDIYLSGPNNDLRGGGTYNVENRNLDFALDINQVQLQLLDPFLSEFMMDSKGSVSGKAQLSGTPEEPNLSGFLNLKDVFTTIVVNQARYGIQNRKIKFDNKSITLGALPITDIEGNTALVSGRIEHEYLSNMNLDLKMSTDKFTFLNTTKADNDIFYGKLKLRATADITGPVNLLDINIIASTLDSSAISISPFSADQYLQQESFIKYGTPDIDQEENEESLLKLAQEYPFKVTLLLSATKKAKLNFIVDPLTGDNIKVDGEGDLRIVISPDGKQEIYGLYTIADGNYFFTYGDFVRRTFAIASGSTLKFNGDPLDAILDINAIYSVNTTSYELIKNEVSFDQSEINASKERSKVDVVLSLAGKISEPLITTDINIPDQESNSMISVIKRKLADLRNDPNELNNQVFGLLIFNSFIVSDNTSSTFSNVGSNIAYSSLSSLVSSQLNKLAGKAFKGVDVNVNVNSYESDYVNEGNGGNITEIGVQLKKQLFNDRLSISAVGNVVDVNNTGDSSYSGFLGDFIVEYNLTEDGTYRLKVFSKSDYDQLLNENANRNGVSIFFNKSFDSKKDE